MTPPWHDPEQSVTGSFNITVKLIGWDKEYFATSANRKTVITLFPFIIKAALKHSIWLQGTLLLLGSFALIYFHSAKTFFIKVTSSVRLLPLSRKWTAPNKVYTAAVFVQEFLYTIFFIFL